MRISEISFGAWAIGASWGTVDDNESYSAMVEALEQGVNFFDTADVYGAGKSEKLIARLRKETGARIFVATKAGRKLNPHVAAAYTPAAIRGFIEESLRNLRTDALDLLQLHCPPTQVYYEPELFAGLDDLKRAGLIKHYGVSVEKIEEAIKAIEFPGVESVQIIFNMFRMRPTEWFFERAKARQVGIIARVPLASGMLTGKMDKDTRFEANDHRLFNRHGESFDVGETFSGVPYETGLAAVAELRKLLPQGASLPAFALKWILMHDTVSCAIPGAKRPSQVSANCAASDLPDLPPETMAAVRGIYDRLIKPHVHQRW
jgi:aryl-alcohol dehydrogenase-like predicted oxidoreductase